MKRSGIVVVGLVALIALLVVFLWQENSDQSLTALPDSHASSQVSRTPQTGSSTGTPAQPKPSIQPANADQSEDERPTPEASDRTIAQELDLRLRDDKEVNQSGWIVDGNGSMVAGAKHEVEILLPPTGGISGQILNAAGQPHAGMYVSLSRTSEGEFYATQLTDNGGNYRFEEEIAGQYFLRVSLKTPPDLPDRGSPSFPITIRADEFTRADIVLDAAPGTQSLKIRPLLDMQAQFVSGSMIGADRRSHYATLGRDGVMDFGEVPISQQFRSEVNLATTQLRGAQNTLSLSFPLDPTWIGNEEVQTINYPASPLELSVETPQGILPGDTTIQLATQSGGAFRAFFEGKPDSKGVLSIPLLPHASYNITLLCPKRSGTRIAHNHQSSAKLTIPVGPKGGRISVTLAGFDGDPAGGTSSSGPPMASVELFEGSVPSIEGHFISDAILKLRKPISWNNPVDLDADSSDLIQPGQTKTSGHLAPGIYTVSIGWYQREYEKIVRVVRVEEGKVNGLSIRPRSAATRTLRITGDMNSEELASLSFAITSPGIFQSTISGKSFKKADDGSFQLTRRFDEEGRWMLESGSRMIFLDIALGTSATFDIPASFLQQEGK